MICLDGILKNIWIFLQVVTPVAKYALTLLPIALSIEELATSPRLRCHAMSVIVRTSLVVLSLLVALCIPYFGKYLHITPAYVNCNDFSVFCFFYFFSWLLEEHLCFHKKRENCM